MILAGVVPISEQKNETNVARVTTVKAGLPVEIPAVTFHRVCMSSMLAIACGIMAIRVGINSG